VAHFDAWAAKCAEAVTTLLELVSPRRRRLLDMRPRFPFNRIFEPGYCPLPRLGALQGHRRAADLRAGGSP